MVVFGILVAEWLRNFGMSVCPSPPSLALARLHSAARERHELTMSTAPSGKKCSAESDDYVLFSRLVAGAHLLPAHSERIPFRRETLPLVGHSILIPMKLNDIVYCENKHTSSTRAERRAEKMSRNTMNSAEKRNGKNVLVHSPFAFGAIRFEIHFHASANTNQRHNIALRLQQKQSI